MSETIRAVLDTQLFLRAAINRKSLPTKLIFDLDGMYQLTVPAAIVVEVTDVLNRPKLRAKFSTLTDPIVGEVTELLSVAEIVNPTDVPAVARDPKDDIFLACAKAAKAPYLVSEDQDLLVLDPYEGVRIINALSFLNAITKPQE